MSIVIYLFARTVSIFLNVLQWAMFIRAVVSWLPIEENRFEDFLYVLTEPVITPLRRLFDKMGWFQSSPIDIAFMVTFLLIAFLSAVVSAFAW